MSMYGTGNMHFNNGKRIKNYQASRGGIRL